VNNIVFNLEEQLKKNNRSQNPFNQNLMNNMIFNGKNTFYPNNNHFQDNLLNIDTNNNYACNVSRRVFEQNMGYQNLSAANEADRFNNPNPLVNYNFTRSNF
jgi:hypothetical protein